MHERPIHMRRTPFLSIEDATSFLIAQVEGMGVQHLSYWYLQYSGGTPDQVIWIATYDPAYMSYYMRHFTPVSDPVISSVMNDKYVDWAEWFENDDLAQQVAELAPRYDITKYGISIPLPADGDDKIIFSACMKSDDQAWPRQRAALARNLLPFANVFDQRMRPLIQSQESGQSVFRLMA